MRKASVNQANRAVKRLKVEANVAKVCGSPGSPTPRSPLKERAPTRRRSLSKNAIVVAPEEKPPEPELVPEPVSNLFKNNPFLMQDRKRKQNAATTASTQGAPPPKQKIPTVSKAEEAKAKLIELMKRLKSPAPPPLPPAAADEYANYDFDDELEAVREADPTELATEEGAADEGAAEPEGADGKESEKGTAEEAEGGTTDGDTAYGFALYDWDDYDFDDDVCDEVRRAEPDNEPPADEYADYDWEDDALPLQEAGVAVGSPAARAVVDERSITERILSGRFDLDELAASAAQLLPMIELELAIARAREAEAKSEPLIQVLRRERRAHKRKWTRR